MNGCETGVYGTDLTSSIARTRRLASHRWAPPFVKRSFNDGEKVGIAAIDPDLV
jgi:hypothetical protein